MNPVIWADVEHPLYEAFKAVTGAEPPEYTKGLAQTTELTGKQQRDLHLDHTSLANPFWATGESIMDVADLIVERAIENANIAEPTTQTGL